MVRIHLCWILLAAASCGVEAGPRSSDTAPTGTELRGEAEWYIAFDQAAELYDVPAVLLQAIAMTETRMQMVRGEEEFEGQPTAHGLMGLRADRLTEGADLAGYSVELVSTDRKANIEAAAAWLDMRAQMLGISRWRLESWAPVVADYSGIRHENARASYVHDEVYAHLREGMDVEGHYTKPIDLEPELDRPQPVSSAGPNNRPYVVWRPSPNTNSRPGGVGGDPSIVVIHSCEGTYSGCWGWLVNSASGVSAHYVVNDSGSEVSQLVDENRRAWHVGATYDCNLNGSRLCNLQGNSVNNFSVGIEHAGYASQSSWSNGLLDASARLTCDITEDHGIPRDSYHIVSHGRLQPYNRTDPGPNWPWTDYISRVNDFCGGGGTTTPPTTTAGQFVIDSNNQANNQSDYYIAVSSNWNGSQNVSGYWNTGYYVAPTAPVSDGAEFFFRSSTNNCYQVDGWWTAAFDRARTATFIAYDASGSEVGRSSQDQSVRGSRWVPLGQWDFTTGWNKVLLSRWTTSGYYVIADALRVTPCAAPACPDSDGDGTCDTDDSCPNDPAKTSPGSCGCGTPDTDSDGDSTPNCNDQCPTDPNKTSPGTCGCGTADIDITGDGVADCTDCGDGIVDLPELCDDGNNIGGDGCSATCQLEGLLLNDFSPRTPGITNTLEARGGAPGAEIFFLASGRSGLTAVPGCPNTWIPLYNPEVVGRDTVDSSGVATVQVPVPAHYAGFSYVLSAVELSTCRVSTTVFGTF